MSGRGLIALGAAAVVTLALASSGGASATEGNGNQRFPELGFEWYVTAPPAPYTEGRPSSPGVDESLADEGIRASYFTPAGSAPARRQGDVDLSIALPYDEPSASDQIDVDLSQLIDLKLGVGARFIDGLGLPQETQYEVTGATILTPEIAWSDSTLTIIRPPMPVDCSATDINQYEFQVVALGDNGYKYLFDVDVSFGKRSVAATNDQKKRCGSGPEETSKPSTTSEPRPQSSEEPAKAVDPETTNEVTTPPEAAAEVAPELPEWLPVPLAVVVVVIGIWFIRRFKKGKTSQPSYANDGTKLSPSTTKRSTDNDDD